MCFGLEFNFAVANKACGEAPDFSHLNGFDKPAPLVLMRPLSYVIALGIESREGGEGRGNASPPVQKFGGDSPRNLGTFSFFKTLKIVLKGILCNYVAVVRGEKITFV